MTICLSFIIYLSSVYIVYILYTLCKRYIHVYPACLPACLSICLSVHIHPACLSVCLSSHISYNSRSLSQSRLVQLIYMFKHKINTVSCTCLTRPKQYCLQLHTLWYRMTISVMCTVGCSVCLPVSLFITNLLVSQPPIITVFGTWYATSEQ